LKTQIIADKSTGRVIAIFVCNGKVHDFKMFKLSKVRIVGHIVVYADSGYQGINDLHQNSVIPTKKPKNGQLTKEQKQENTAISKIRIKIEHINRRIKRFRIFSTRYRNRRKRFALRMSLLCGIHNWELQFCA